MIAAAVQMTSGPNVIANLAKASDFVQLARAQGAELVVLPENFSLMSPREGDKIAAAESLTSPGPILTAMASLARSAEIYLILGGMPERSPDPNKVFNTCVLLGPDGSLRAAYRKIHLFDVQIPDGATYHESATVHAGRQAVVADTPWGRIGLSVCYDVRFPELYRLLTAAGARIHVVPAAFTAHTGKAHWHVLLRARAIENQAFVIAPGQFGQHDEKRVTYGHSLIIDPWGTVLAEAPDGEGAIVAELDFDRQDEIRRDLPCLAHRFLNSQQ